jgi:hypothetical protein
MSLRTFILVFTCFISSVAGAQDSEIEKLMPDRVLTTRDVQYNIMRLVPRLHAEGKEDVILNLISYTDKNYGTMPELAPYIILHSIKNRTFREDIRYTQVSTGKYYQVSDSAHYTKRILGYYLSWYHDKFNNKAEDERDAPLYYRQARAKYIAFLASFAKEMLNTPGLTPVESWLLSYFIDPRQELVAQLGSDVYESSSLQQAWMNYHKDEVRLSAVGYAVTAGIWSPVGKLSFLGPHPSIGYTVGGKSANNFFVDFRIDIRFLRSPVYYQVQMDTLMLRTNYFFGVAIGLDGGYEIKRGKNAMDIIGGIAYESMSAISSRDHTYIDFNSSYYNNRNTGGRSSFCMNAGLAYKRYLTHKIKNGNVTGSYLSLQVRYHWLFFNNFSGTDMSGGAWTCGITYGGFSRSAKRYNILNEK